MSTNLYYSELDSDQILYEIVKRFSLIEYSDEELSIYDIFGEEWGMLNVKARKRALKWFHDDIEDKLIKGIIYIKKGARLYSYKRIPNDVYQK